MVIPCSPYLALVQRSDVTSAVLGPAPVIGLCWGLRKDDIRAQHSDRLETGNTKIEHLEALFQLSLIFRNQFHLEKFKINKKFHRVSSFVEFLGIRKFSTKQ